ncbi:MAG: FAD-dependent monooxygenase [Herpetosiphonaceae bacterium]|nr:FAD-dependent monooxygenase [Herpetosiphonaceae bacterium]
MVIGGGIGGLALSLFLKKAGIVSTVYEAAAYKAGDGGGLNIAPNGMKVLAALGLAPKTIACGSVARECCFRNKRGKTLARYSNGTVEKYGQPSVSMTRSALYDVLKTEMHAQGLHVHYEKRLKDITQDSSQIVAHFADGTSAKGDLLIGADGIHSQTRKLILPNGPAPDYVGIIGAGGVVSGSAVPSLTQRDKESLNFTYGPQGFFGYMGVHDGNVMWWANLPRATELTRAELTNFSLESLKQEMLAIYRGYHMPVEALITNTHTPVLHNISDIRSLPTWHKGRIVLIGDAAHAVSPNAGQGASLALEDAMYLAKLLRDSAAGYEHVFTQFEHERKPRVEKIVAEGRRRGNDKAIVSPFQAKIREIMIMIFVNAFGKMGRNWLYNYPLGWEASPL